MEQIDKLIEELCDRAGDYVSAQLDGYSEKTVIDADRDLEIAKRKLRAAILRFANSITDLPDSELFEIDVYRDEDSVWAYPHGIGNGMNEPVETIIAIKTEEDISLDAVPNQLIKIGEVFSCNNLSGYYKRIK